MRLAISLAQKARPSPNPRVGAVIVKNGKIIGKGFHRKAGEPHAEINAIEDAKQKNVRDFSGCTLYITMEPCCHANKRTPPCVERIIGEKIKQIVISEKDPNPSVSGKGISILRKKGIKIRTGILKNEAKEMNEGYNFFITKKKPLVVIKAAISLDGKLATESGDSQWISNDEARLLAHKMRTKYDSILVGIGTVLKDNPRLTSRINGGTDPLRVIIDSVLKIPLNANVLADRNAVIFTTKRCNRKKKKALEKKGYEVIIAGNNEVDLKKMISILGGKGITSIMVEGGARIIESFLKQKLADEAKIVIAPMLIGGKNAPGLLAKGADKVKNAMKLKNVEYKIIDDNVMIEGRLKAD